MAFDLTTVGETKQALAINSTKHDAYLNRLIPAISGQIANDLNRVGDPMLLDGLEQKARTDVLDVAPGQRTFALTTGTIATLTDARYDPLRTFGAASIINAENIVIRDAAQGLIYVDFALLTNKRDRGVQTLQVNYTGGMFTDLDDLRVKAPQLEAAVWLQVQSILARQKTSALEFSISGQGGTVNHRALRLIPAVREMIRPFRRPNAGH